MTVIQILVARRRSPSTPQRIVDRFTETAKSLRDALPSRSSDGGAGRPIGALLVLLLLAGLLWYFRPWFHGIAYALYSTPVIIAIAVVALFLAAATGKASQSSGSMGMVLAAIVVVAMVAGPFLAGEYASEEIADEVMADSESVGQLHEADETSPRIVPKAVASTYAANTLSLPQYQATNPDVTIRNGTPYWSYALSPDGLFNYLTKKQYGSVLVDMTSQDARVETRRQTMDRGIGTAFWNRYKWKLLKQGNYWANYHDPFMVVENDSQYIAVPYTVPEFHVRALPVPIPYTTPKWGGVALIDSSGTMQDLSPSEARSHPALTGEKLYPFDLTRRYVAATKYRHGILNVYTSHEDEIEVAPVPGGNNEQPFLTMTETAPGTSIEAMNATTGLTYFTAAEPYGNAQGLSEVWMTNGRTGEYEVYRPPDGQSLAGPGRATEYVRQAARQTDWDRFNPSEPIPVVVNDTLYWEVRVVPNGGSGISYIAFVNAESLSVQEVETTQQVSAFLDQSRSVQTNASTGQNGTALPSGDSTVVVQKVSENGTVVDTIVIQQNETVRVQSGNNSTQEVGA